MRTVCVIMAAVMVVTGWGVSTHPSAQNKGPWNYECFVPVTADVHTTVNLWRIFKPHAVSIEEESIKLYTLFDGVIDRDCLLTFVYQPQFWSYDRNVDTAVILPAPAGLESGIYMMETETPDSTYYRKFVLMK